MKLTFWHLAETVVWGLSDNLQILEYLCNSVLYNIAGDCSEIENSRQISLLCSSQLCRPTTRLSHYLTCLFVLGLGLSSLPKLTLTCPSKSVQWHNSANSSLCYWTTHRMLHITNHRYFYLWFACCSHLLDYRLHGSRGHQAPWSTTVPSMKQVFNSCGRKRWKKGGGKEGEREGRKEVKVNFE